MMNEIGENTTEVAEISAGAMSVAEREKQEIQSAIISAKRFPRNEIAAETAILKSCERPGFAELVQYRFKRGKSYVEGPSVTLAREMAKKWGNIKSSVRVIDMTKDYVHIKAVAHDLETNAIFDAEDRFDRLIQRRVFENGKETTKWIAPDERDLRELINRRGALAIRNCLLQIIPADITDKARDIARETLRKLDHTALKTSREDTIKNLARSFDKIGVSVANLEEWLSHPLQQITEDELGELRGIRAAIKDGQSKAWEFFGTKKSESQSVLAEKLKPEVSEENVKEEQ